MKKLTIFLALFISLIGINNFLLAQCAAPTAQADLDIANVRARIQCGGDMWWDAVASLGPKYEVPIGSGKYSMFSGGLWVGGVDGSNNLHVAAQTYRQSGSDFWAGPLDTTSALVSPTTCSQFDQVWKITRQEVVNFIGGGPTTTPISTWPGNGSGNQAHYLAPFHDANGDGIYNPANGDYPDFGFAGSPNCCNILHGDQAIWWVINDAGNIHTETSGASLGIEMQCQAFAYNTNDADINNTTFYQYLLINRSTNTYHSTYFGIYADADLGNYLDDYIGCDVPRGMGYCYNGDSDDDGPSGYGLFPPAIGIDFLKGPLADAGDGVDNNRNCLTDEAGEEIIMSNFQYWNNDFTNSGNPQNATHYYNYLKSVWKNGSHVTYGGFGNGTGNGATNIPSNFMFPGNSDQQYGWGMGGNCTTPAPQQADWDEYIAGNVPYDRRFLMSAGPFTLSPGAVHCITAATIWARDLTSPGPFYSLAALQAADDKVQLFFDNCFDINVLGINEKENVHADIFPNPVNELLEVNLGNIITEGTFSVYDVTGRIVKQVSLKQQQKFSVSCKDLSSGIYVYRILLPNGKTNGGRFIKE